MHLIVQTLAAVFLLTIMASCGSSFNSGGSPPSPFSAADATQAKVDKNDSVGNGNTAGNATGSDVGNGSVAGGAGTSGGASNGDIAGGAGTSPTTTVQGTGTNGVNVTNGTGAVAASSGKWKANQVITDLVTLEFCKLEAARITGDASIILKCFAKYVAGGMKITALDCGCVQQTTTTTISSTGTSQSTTTTPVP